MTNSILNSLEEKLIASTKSYLPELDVKRIKEAIVYAAKMHRGSKRMSGEDYIVHPLNTALKLASIKMDTSSIIAGLLHDVVEDTDADHSEIKKRFSSDVANLVEGVTKLGSIRIKKGWFPFTKTEIKDLDSFERQVETLRKMMVAMSKDVRVVIIKMADKIHNLKTLQHLSRERQERISREAIEIFAPIAGRLGMGEWKGEIEDLSFPYILPDEFAKLQKLAIPKIRSRERYLKKVTAKVKENLDKNSIKAEINFRAKRWFSLYRKLIKYDNDISKVYDLIAVRIIVDSVEDCYSVLGIIHSMWHPLVGRIKDFIALPKPNGYRSIHTTVSCDDGKIVEFQIRTKEMHYQAEFGIASHWIYEQKKVSKMPNKKELEWLKGIDKIQKTMKSPADLIEFLKMDFFEDRIFVFTPEGDVKDLPIGSTSVDFAYYIHTDVGNHCAGAIVNGRIAPFDRKLENGDIVEIIKRKSAKPHADWLKFVRTELAKSQIRKLTKT